MRCQGLGQWAVTRLKSGCSLLTTSHASRLPNEQSRYGQKDHLCGRCVYRHHFEVRKVGFRHDVMDERSKKAFQSTIGRTLRSLTCDSVPTYPIEDEKLRATGCSRRRGGNCANTLEVLSQLVEQRNSPAAEGQVALYLLSVLPTRDSSDAQFIGKSLQGVDIDKGCVFRESFENAAASYIIQSTTNSSRTIVSHNPLPEMTTREFINSASNIQRQSGAASYWYHFEGRIPTVTGESVDWLRSEVPLAKISVECEKPERAYMMDVSKRADVVFFSKIWAEVSANLTRR